VQKHNTIVGGGGGGVFNQNKRGGEGRRAQGVKKNVTGRVIRN